MAKIIKSRFGNFLVILVMGAVFITVFLFFKNFSTEAQEQIKIFPTSFTGDWQNPGAVFSQDLGENATFEEFNIENSTYPLEILETPPEEVVTPPEEEIILPVEEEIIEEETPPEETPEEEIPTEENPLEEESEESIEEPIEEPAEQEQQEESTAFWDKIKGLLKGTIVWAQEESQEENQEETLNEEEPLPQEELPEEPVAPEESAIEEPTTEEPVIEEPVIEVEIPPIEKILELSNFSISEDFQERTIQNVQLRLSLAGKGEVGDKLIIDYFYQDSWQILAEYELENEISNALNGGYFLYALPIFETWEELDTLKIKFTYVDKTNSQSLVYLDAIWLEVEYEEKELIVEEEIIEEKEEETEEDVREEFILELISERKDFKLDEIPIFKFRYQKERNLLESISAGILGLFRDEYKDINIKATVLGLNTTSTVRYLENGEFFVGLETLHQFRPGKYRLKIDIEDNGQTFTQEQEFTWGVLAINTNKSIYLPEERVYLQMAVLQDDGHTICDANLSLTITAPKGEIANPPVQRSGECRPNNVTDVPDYFAYYQVGEAGIYQTKLTHYYESGSRSIDDSFEVRDSVPFEVERIGPTRIYPPETYEMRFRIKTNQDFVGEVIEAVPADFEVQSSVLGFRFQVSEDEKNIIWNVDWKTGESYELKYTFDAPNASPYLYLLGPLKIGEFEEIRQWQIAADAPDRVVFTTSDTWQVPEGVTSVQVLVVAGGGGGGNSGTYGVGGGGAGGVIYNDNYSVTPLENITVTVGAGGAGATTYTEKGGNGENSVFGSITAIGGGGGSSTVDPGLGGNDGGSGGGGGYSAAGGLGTAGQGNDGGDSLDNNSGGGGGGKGAAGADGSGNNGGNGGTGAYYGDIFGDDVGVSGWFGGGGGGTGTSANGSGGQGGGGGGTGVSGTANTGGGGGGAIGATGGAGGSGVVIVLYEQVLAPTDVTLHPADGTNQIAFNNIRTNDATPIFRVSATHTANFDRFQIELNDNPTFGDAAEHTQTFSGTYTSGTQYNLTLSGFSPSDNTTYYVRARASADGGSNYGDWSTENQPIWSYTYSTAAEVPQWFQTTTEQFDTDTLTDTEAAGGSVKLKGW